MRRGGVYDAHKHETFQYFNVIAGKARVIVGGEERIVEKGTWIFVPPFIDHHLEREEHQPIFERGSHQCFPGGPHYE